ncbi:MAG: hypothetical protein ACR2P2_00550 [Nakamurella sp.]
MPIWFGVTISVYFAPASIVGVLVLLSLAPLRIGLLGRADLLLMMFFLACLAPIVSGGATLTAIFVVVSQWVVAFLLGRLMPARVGSTWIYSCVAVVFTIVAGLALIEFFGHWNPFVDIGPANALHATWGVLQERGGLLRAEGAFGHSIALGSSVALAIPLTLASGFRPLVRILLVVLMLGATVVTISRVSIIDAAIALLLAVIFLSRGLARSVRVGGFMVLLAASAAATPFIVAVLAKAGGEAINSAGYRSNLTDLIPYISPLGFSSVATRSASGELYFGRFQSIDSQLILTGLTYGWPALICGVLLLVGAVLATLRRTANPATLAIAAQIPALASVALITQYSMFFWFVVGLAAARTVDHVGEKPAREQGRGFLPSPHAITRGVVHSGPPTAVAVRPPVAPKPTIDTRRTTDALSSGQRSVF